MVISPDYEYMNTSVSGTTFTFTGSASDISGIRVTGKVRTSEITGSWEARVREISAFSTRTTDVFDIANESEISVFPNPLSTGSLSIILPERANRLSIADISGRIIFQTQVNKKEYLIDHSVFKQNGIYMITVFTSEKSFYKKLIFSK
ncbi:MAG: T9SS type A sorting domain-containing protein [Draconibacterium sp.]|nr:T9SS type A sorting domain-containing protein [Draconibacterium sp.]